MINAWYANLSQKKAKYKLQKNIDKFLEIWPDHYTDYKNCIKCGKRLTNTNRYANLMRYKIIHHGIDYDFSNSKWAFTDKKCRVNANRNIILEV